MRKYVVLILIFVAVFCWSGYNPKDYFTWCLEVGPAVVGLILLIVTYSKFKFTILLYWLMLVHSIILMVGGHYTYAEVPLFDWLKELMHLSRNNYDKVGHFAQGFIPAMIVREILIRKVVLKNPNWLPFVVISFCMALSAFYELLEWGVAELSGTSAEAFLGTQGYVWDTQSDMLLATIGAVIALLTLSNYHDKLLLINKPS